VAAGPRETVTIDTPLLIVMTGQYEIHGGYMFWKRKTTETDVTSNVQNAARVAPPDQVVPVASVGAANLNAATDNRPYEAVVPVPVTSVTDAGMANVATADRTYQPDVRRSYTLMKITQFVWLLAGVLETLFAVRIILKLIAANASAGFAQFITNLTAPFLAPFAGLITNPTASNGSVLEITTLIAMLVYALLAWGIVRLLWIVFERRIAR
jgi:YGGT family